MALKKKHFFFAFFASYIWTHSLTLTVQRKGCMHEKLLWAIAQNLMPNLLSVKSVASRCLMKANLKSTLEFTPDKSPTNAASVDFHQLGHTILKDT